MGMVSITHFKGKSKGVSVRTRCFRGNRMVFNPIGEKPVVLPRLQEFAAGLFRDGEHEAAAVVFGGDA